MLGFLIRRLPFWVREPLLIVVGSVFGVRITYLAVRDLDRVAACIGAVFLVFTAIRVHVVVRALRARRGQGPAASAAGTGAGGGAAVQAQPQDRVPGARSEAGPGPGPAIQEKEPNAWLQAFAALGVFAVLAALAWLDPHLPSGDNTPKAASCSSSEDEALPKVYGQRPRPLTGDELCEALDRPDLARLLGTPEEVADTVSGDSRTALLSDGKVAQPEAEIRFETYTVNISATYDELTTAQYVKLMKSGSGQDVRTLTVLGRPAILSSDHTLQFEVSLGTGGGTGGPAGEGPLARTLTVALDPEDRGGHYELTVWSTSGALLEDGVLQGIAEKILPTLPERTA
ncbi:DUF6215 domain-containing protein [Streptomyces sp. NPDC018610]|uniref:DUF6215 domain-containing protein n=1 Tax=Streptomyces sp. NPDC018610 TaxID=3365049 RepID=UPI0037B7EF3B